MDQSICEIQVELHMQCRRKDHVSYFCALGNLFTMQTLGEH